MKAIVYKIDDKILAVAKVEDLTPAEFVKAQKECIKNAMDQAKEKLELEQKVENLEKENVEFKKELERVWKQFAIDHGEVEEGE